MLMPANMIVPAATPGQFLLPSQSVVSTQLLPIPGFPAAPQIGFGPLGGVAPPPEAPKTAKNEESNGTKGGGGGGYNFTPQRSGYRKTHHFTNGLDGFDPGSIDPEYQEFKKLKYRDDITS